MSNRQAVYNLGKQQHYQFTRHEKESDLVRDAGADTVGFIVEKSVFSLMSHITYARNRLPIIITMII